MNFPGPAYRYTPEEMARKVYGAVKAPERLPATSSRWQDQEEYKSVVLEAAEALDGRLA